MIYSAYERETLMRALDKRSPRQLLQLCYNNNVIVEMRRGKGLVISTIVNWMEFSGIFFRAALGLVCDDESYAVQGCDHE